MDLKEIIMLPSRTTIVLAFHKVAKLMQTPAAQLWDCWVQGCFLGIICHIFLLYESTFLHSKLIYFEL